MVLPFDFIDQLIQKNHWDYLYHCFGIVYPRVFQDFYGYLEVIQDEQSSLTLQTIVRGVTFRVDDALIGTDPIPFEGSSFLDSMVSFTMEELLMFFDPHHQAQDRVSFYQDRHIFLFASSSCKNCAA